MTTNKQLQEWLKRFPDDAGINVITTEEDRHSYQSYTSVCEVELELPDVVMGELKWSDDYPTVEFILHYKDGETVGVREITLGKKG